MLDGYKTYIAAAVIGLLTALNYLGILDDENYKTLVGLVGSLGLAALRAGVKGGK